MPVRFANCAETTLNEQSKVRLRISCGVPGRVLIVTKHHFMNSCFATPAMRRSKSGSAA
jgi:hypothetical protein